MTAGYEVVVVGGGIIGAAVAFHLAEAGVRRVLVCEQAMPPGRGATTRSGGLLRQHHTARCDVDLAVRGISAYHDWAARVGGDAGYRRTGFAVLVAGRYADALAKNVAAVNEAGGRSEVITPGELAALHPGLAVPADVAVGYEPDGGYADAVTATRELLAAAVARGVTVAEGVRVTGIDTTGDRVRAVHTNLGAVHTDRVVLCGGAWSGELLAALRDGDGLDLPALPVTARRIAIARAATAHSPGALPIGIDDTLGTYFRPADDGGMYFGVPLDPAVDPAADPEPMTGPAARAAATTLVPRVPALRDAPVLAARVGFDAYSADKRPVIGPAGPEGLYLCTAFSGGGVKVAPAVGELAADEIVHGTTAPLLEPYRPRRFGAGALIESEFPYEHM
ncbi:NAD(P)/FAD-dependent oxidoreductase [Streptomyces sp.]|uniref:NAD(P)/FAD-dependent oxidoreductase n=1 Tax=Streptomyces sp. TaxID=1931 RepID=UPI002F41EDC1